jgi:hypothetical protein
MMPLKSDNHMLLCLACVVLYAGWMLEWEIDTLIGGNSLTYAWDSRPAVPRESHNLQHHTKSSCTLQQS